LLFRGRYHQLLGFLRRLGDSSRPREEFYSTCRALQEKTTQQTSSDQHAALQRSGDSFLQERTIRRLSWPMLPAIFQEHCFEPDVIDSWTGEMISHGITLDDPQLAGKEFGLIKAALALRYHKFTIAAKELGAVQAHAPRSAPAYVAREILEWLRERPLVAAHLVEERVDPRDLSTFRDEKILLIADVKQDTLLSLLGKISETNRLTLLSDQQVGAAKGLALRQDLRVVAPDSFVWFSDQGRTIHERLEIIARAGALSLAGKLEVFKQVFYGTYLFLIDRYLYDYWQVETAYRLIQENHYDRVVLLTRRYWHYRTFASMLAQSHRASRGFNVLWEGDVLPLKEETIPFWPGSHHRKEFEGQLSSPERTLASKIYEIVKNVKQSGVDKGPAVIIWALRDRNYLTGFCRMAEALLLEYSLIVLLTTPKSELFSSAEAHLQVRSRATGHAVCFVDISELDAAGKSSLSACLPAVSEAIKAGIDRSASGALHDPGKACLVNDIAMGLGQSPLLLCVVAYCKFVEALVVEFPNIPYVVTTTGRSYDTATFAEEFERHSIRCIDVHCYLASSHARQLPPPHSYAAVVDDQQEHLLCTRWGFRLDQILRAGYIWRDEASDSFESSDRQAALVSPLVLICTQPGYENVSELCLENILSSIALHPAVRAIVKPHPRESAPVLDRYRQIVLTSGCGDRVEIVDAKVDLMRLIHLSDLVITRTSNVGLEAGALLKPVIRYIEFDMYSSIIHERCGYAENVETAAALKDRVPLLLFDEKARNALKVEQQAYLDRNPGQKLGDGAARIVAFMERFAKASGADKVRDV